MLYIEMTGKYLTGKQKELFDFHFNNGKITIIDGTYTLQEILDKNDEWWDSNHDFIQWLYPTDEISKYNPTAPLLDKNLAKIFMFMDYKRNKNLYYRFRKFIEDNAYLQFKFNHNYLRFSRFLRHIALINGNIMAVTILRVYIERFNLLRQNAIPSFYFWLDSTQAKFED